MINPKTVYSVVFISLSLWMIYAYLTTTEIIKSQKKYAHIINVSGKQRMLSQKTTLIAKRYYETKDPLLKSHLNELYHLMKNDHNEIISKYLTSNKIKNIYFDDPVNLDDNIQLYFSQIEQFMTKMDMQILSTLEITSFKLLSKLNNVVYVFERESNDQINELMRRELIILVGGLLTLLFEAVVIVFPSIRIANLKNSELQKIILKRTVELEKLSQTDALTKIYNRRKLDEILIAKLARAERYNQLFSLVLIDIDHFKKVNDTYGHQVGDDVLKAISKLFFDSIRKTDMIGRWGGEEFLIVSLENNYENVLVFAEKLRAIIESHDFPVVGRITCSFGVSYYIKSDTLHNLINRADTALYQAKSAGRNCVKLGINEAV